jgi:ABC-type phosphate transport system substrate-binding protein
MKNLFKNFKNIALATTLMLSFNLWAEVSIVVHPSNTSSLTEKDVSRIFLGKIKSFDNGSEVVPVSLQEGDPSRAEFNEKLLGRSDSQLKAYWSKLVFTGKGTPPKEVSDNSKIIELISKNPSMIGYIDSSAVTGDVKVVLTF